MQKGFQEIETKMINEINDLKMNINHLKGENVKEENENLRKDNINLNIELENLKREFSKMGNSFQEIQTKMINEINHLKMTLNQINAENLKEENENLRKDILKIKIISKMLK